ncbi:putative toxin [Pseudarthrobacter sp. GA104]|uniref:putative toxin n=1 Tax=Pseudarthrobacter sp. GA104 TaxID=2676311 RepID=UPI0018D1FACB|nr:putative toxin [Pseudarthrobacter sp. GA104]
MLTKLSKDWEWLEGAHQAIAISCIPVLAVSLLAKDPNSDLQLISSASAAMLKKYPLPGRYPDEFAASYFLQSRVESMRSRSSTLIRVSTGDLKLHEQRILDDSNVMKFAYAGIYIGFRAIEKVIGENLEAISKTVTPDWQKAIEFLQKSMTRFDVWIRAALKSATGSADEQSLKKWVERISALAVGIGTYTAVIQLSQYIELEAPWYLTDDVLQIGLIDLAGRLFHLLEDLNDTHGEYGRLANVAQAYSEEAKWRLDRLQAGLEAGSEILKLGDYIGVVSGVLGLASLAKSLASIAANVARASRPVALVSGGSVAGSVALREVDILAKAVEATTAFAVAAGGGGSAGPKRGGAAPVQTGRAGEQARGISPEDKEWIISITDSSKSGFRIPDKLTSLGLEEVKNVLRLSLTKQLEDFILFAGANEIRFTLVVRAGTRTKLSAPLLELEAKGIIEILRVL